MSDLSDRHVVGIPVERVAVRSGQDVICLLRLIGFQRTHLARSSLKLTPAQHKTDFAAPHDGGDLL